MKAGAGPDGGNEMELNGVAAIVTGGASGLGAATAAMLAEKGARVAAIDLVASVAASAKEIGGLGILADVSEAESLARAFGQARDAHGPARVLVNCAGILGSAKAFDRDRQPLALDHFAQVIAVNLIGTFNAIRLAAADMAGLEALADGERGVVVNTASVSAFEGQIGQPAYSASKGGIVAMTLPLAREFARHGIRVVSIAPGPFRTPMLDGAPSSLVDDIVAEVPYPTRLGEPEEFAALVEHICANRMLNGATLRLDAALRLPPK